jgi:hypothetical protein
MGQGKCISQLKKNNILKPWTSSFDLTFSLGSERKGTSPVFIFSPDGILFHVEEMSGDARHGWNLFCFSHLTYMVPINSTSQALSSV